MKNLQKLTFKDGFIELNYNELCC